MSNAVPEAPPARKEMPSVKLEEAEFRKRFLAQYVDPAFDDARQALDTVADRAWDAYIHSRKSPHTLKAGKGFADPGYELSVDWLAAKAAVDTAQVDYESRREPKVLVINCASRSEHTCPGESSKSYRLAKIAEAALTDAGVDTGLLDLSRAVSEYGRNIHPCKTCFSTAAPLCHWPCTCYPNYSLGQTQDWMNEIYPMWVGADGILIVTPVNWYQVSSPLKLMMDRLVCADGGNPDPTSTEGKENIPLAKEIELKGWDYPQHLKGRMFSVIVHGDVEGAEGVRRSVSEWLSFMGLEPAGIKAELDRYIGYWEPYATSHEALDRDLAVQGEVRQAAAALAEGVKAKRNGTWVSPASGLTRPRRK